MKRFFYLLLLFTTVLTTSCCKNADDEIIVLVEDITLEPPYPYLIIGDTLRLKVIFTPYNATNKNVTWESSNETVATVDKDGKVTTIIPGTATITVKTLCGGHTATCVVTVL